MNKKLKILSILIITLYCYSVVDNLAINFSDIFYNQVDKIDKTNDQKYLLFYGNLFCDQDQQSFVEKEINQKDGKEVILQKRKVSILAPIADIPFWYSAYALSLGLLSLLAVVVLIYIPFLFFKTLRLVSRNNIFTRENIKRIRRLGYCVVGLCMYDSYIFVSQNYLFSMFIKIDGYKATYHGSIDVFGLIFGLTLLLIAEALRQALAMKEEQELTI